MAIHTRFAALAAAWAVASLALWRGGRPLSAACSGYWATVLGVMSVLMRALAVPTILGKNPATGVVPLWSYVVFLPVHFFNHLFVNAKTLLEVAVGFKGGYQPATRLNLANIPALWRAAAAEGRLPGGLWVGGRDSQARMCAASALRGGRAPPRFLPRAAPPRPRRVIARSSVVSLPRVDRPAPTHGHRPKAA